MTHLLESFALVAAFLLRPACAEQTDAGGATEFTGEAGEAAQTDVSDLAAATAEAHAYRPHVLKTAARN